MSMTVITGPAALSYVAANGHTYWMGYASGHQPTGIPRRSADKAIEDARKLEKGRKMTELQLAIGHLKETISVGNVLLAKLEEKQKEAEKPKVPEFPYRFIVVRDKCSPDQFIIGLETEGGTGITSWDELPPTFKGRAFFSKYDLRDIVSRIQILLGDTND